MRKRAARHHVLDIARDEPLAEKGVIPLMAVARDPLTLAVVLQKVAKLVREFVEIAVEGEFLIRENLVIAGRPRNEDEQSVTRILREAV